MLIRHVKFGKQWLMTFLYLICCVIVKAQPSEIITDRPDQTESSVVVGKGILQIETGVVFSKRDYFIISYPDYLQTRDFATTLVRYGIHDRIELRLASAYTVLDYSDPHPTFKGLQPLSVGAKIALAAEHGIWPEIAFIGHLTLPWIGDDVFVPDHVTPDFRFSFAHTLSDRFSLGYNLGMEWGDGVCCIETILYTISLGASLFGPVSGFIESYGDIGDFLNQVDYGFTALINPDLQIDFSHGFCLWCNDNDHFFNAGISARFGGKQEE